MFQVFLVLLQIKLHMSHEARKPVFGVSDHVRNQAIQPEKMARGLKFQIQKVEGLYYLCSKIKGADQLLGYHASDLRLCFPHMQNAGFSHDLAHI